MRRIAIVVCSDRCNSGEVVDTTGPALRQFFQDNPRLLKSADASNSLGEDRVVMPSIAVRVVPDDAREIREQVLKYCDEQRVHLLVTAGGTGFSRRDITPETVGPLLHKQAPGLVHCMMAYSLTQTKYAWLSRPVAGVRGETLVICVPGSPKAAIECLTPLIDAGLDHAIELASGNQKDVHPRLTESQPALPSPGGSHPAEANQSPAMELSGGDHHPYSTVESGAWRSDSFEGSGNLYPPHSTSRGAHGGPARLPPMTASKDHGAPPNKRGGTATTVGPTASPPPLTQPPLSKDRRNAAKRDRESPFPMVPMESALQIIAANCPQPAVQNLTTFKPRSVLGHVLAEDVLAQFPHPPFRASTKDGYAVVASDGPGEYPVVGALLAGSSNLNDHLKSGQITRVNTGGPLPEGADAVIQVEDTTLVKADEETGVEYIVKINKATTVGHDIRPIGVDLEKGAVAIKAGLIIRAAELGLAHGVGAQSLTVYRRPIVAVISTGDELCDMQQSVEGQLPPGHIFDSNRVMLLAALDELGYEVIDFGIAKDDYEDTWTKISRATSKADIIITSGGVSMGEVDFVKDVLMDLGAKIHFGRVNMKPGKPTTFATKAHHMFFGLPGNPVSAMVCLHLFVLPALRQFEGKPAAPTTFRAVVEHDFVLDSQRPEYHRVRVSFNHEKGLFIATSTGIQASHRLQSMSGANGLACLPVATAEQQSIPAGGAIVVIPVGPLGV